MALAAEPAGADLSGDEDAEAAVALQAASDLLEASGPPADAVSTEGGPDAALTSPGLAELLVTSGQVTREEMEAALREHAGDGEVPRRDPERARPRLRRGPHPWLRPPRRGMEFVDLNEQPLDPEATKLIPEQLARRHRVLALSYRGDTPVIGMANPSDVFAIDDLRTLLGPDIHIVVCSTGQISEYLSRVYRHDRETTLAAQTAASQTSASDETRITELTDLHAVVEDAPIVKYVNLILRQALQERASDIHIEPTADDIRIRFRIDGVLHEITRSPKAIQGGVSTRLKVMASLDIAEHRVPQDGRITLTAGRREIDMRVATLPTVHGEKVVLRVLDKSTRLAQPLTARVPAQCRESLRARLQASLRDHPRDRPDRVGQVDDPVCHLERAQLPRAQPHHGRGPGRVPAPRGEPGAGEPEGRSQLRERPALDPSFRPGRDPRRRDPRPRDRRHRRSRRRSRATWFSRAFTPTTPLARPCGSSRWEWSRSS